MELFDSHAHYNDEKFDEDRETIIESIYKEGVTKFVSAGYDLKSSKDGLELAKKYKYVYTSCGISPDGLKNNVKEIDKEVEELEIIVKEELENSKSEGREPKIIGIGEIGLDYYWNKENKEIQQYTFKKQIVLAQKYDLPIIIHTREAVMDTITILKKEKVSSRKGVFHCCPLNRELVKEALKLGFYISFAGPVTFKSSKNASEIIKMVPLDKILIETDSPYLAPEPVRGRRNDSRNVKYIAEKVATEKNLTIEEIAKATYDNACKLFNIK